MFYFVFLLFVLFLSLFGFLFVFPPPSSHLTLTFLDLVWFLTDKPKSSLGASSLWWWLVVVVMVEVTEVVGENL